MSVEAERSVLGAVMLDPAACDEVAEILQPSDFSTPAHQAVYAAVRRLHDAGDPTDAVAVEAALAAAGELVGHVDATLIYSLTDAVATASAAGYHAGIVLDEAKRRRVRDGAAKAIALANDQGLPTEDMVELARAAFDDVDAGVVKGVQPIGSWIRDYVAGLAEKPSYTPTPWHDLNQLIFGFRDGGMYVAAARPGDGKSMMAVQIALAFAEHRPVLFVSLEMAREEIAGRMIAAHSQVFIGSLNKHRLSNTETEAAEVAAAHFEKLPIVIVDSSHVSTIPQLKAAVRSVHRIYRRNPVVIVDYLQLLNTHERVENRQQAVAGFSRALKLAAQQWLVPVIALSQLNRANAGRKGKAAEPQLTDLRESGAIEQDADVVLLLHRFRAPGRDELKVIVAKNRQGQTGELTLIWQGQFSRVLSKYQANEFIA
ncbi:DnaB-like helicase C-terminal domain-containing protein [Microbacterium sp. 5K110]|uniref:replicative DNA helicase n=1 Tax=Microbacterium sp. 5K110 TaxID=2578104 RepID=UPI0010FDB9E8|nr:hypothetical protein FE256_03960 [Microbacterium sp. 5K110]